MSTVLLLFVEYFKIGLFAVGGGLATLPFLFDLADKYPAWLSYADISTMLAVSESTPGAIGVNMATFCGAKVASVPGSLAATFGLIAPSIIIILIVARILEKFKDNIWVKRAFYGLRATVIGLICYAGWQVYRITIFTPEFSIRPKQTILLCVLTFCMIKFKKVSPIIWLVAAAVLGIVLQL
jgi:Chromate transport protein ChrA